MRRLFSPVFILILSLPVAAQTDSSLLQEIKSQLEKKQTSVSAVLTQEKYSRLHPLTPFRELIREYSSPAVLQITAPGEAGKKIMVTGLVKNSAGQPVPNALVYLYQTDARGWYAADAPHVKAHEGDMRHARLFGYVRTGMDGRFELHTIKPSGYPGSDLPAHIHVHVWATGFLPYVNEFLFDDDDRLTGTIREQSVRNRFLIQKPGKAPAPFAQHFSYTLTLSPG